MKIFASLLVASMLITISSFAADSHYVCFNAGGHKIFTTTQRVRASGSSLLERLLNDKTHDQDSHGRIIIDCGPDVARTMHNFLCHEKIFGDDLELARETGQFFECDKLTTLAEQQIAHEDKTRCGLIEIHPDFQYKENNEYFLICPLCKKDIKLSFDSQFDNAFCHLKFAHQADFLRIDRADNFYRALVRYEPRPTTENQEEKFRILVATMPHAWDGNGWTDYRFCLYCSRDGREYGSFLVHDNAKNYEEKFTDHYKQVHNATTIYIDHHIALLLFALPSI